MTKPQRFASSLRLSRLCRWLLTAAAFKVALLVAFALEQPWPFATDAAPTAVSAVTGVSGASGVTGMPGAAASTQADATARTVHALQAGQAVQSVQYGQDAESQPLAADIARAVGLTAAAPAPASASASQTGANDARGRLNREGTAWAAEAQPAPGTAQSPAAPAAPAAPSSALPAAAGLPGSSTMGSGSAAPAAAQPGAQSTQATQAAMDALNRKQDDLSRREQERKSLEQQVDAKLAQMQDLEARIKTMLKDAQGMKDEKLRHLVDVYTNMKAKQAAAVLETLDEKIAVRILAGMRGRQAGEILTFVQAEKAAKLSEALTRMQLPLE